MRLVFPEDFVPLTITRPRGNLHICVKNSLGNLKLSKPGIDSLRGFLDGLEFQSHAEIVALEIGHHRHKGFRIYNSLVHEKLYIFFRYRICEKFLDI